MDYQIVSYTSLILFIVIFLLAYKKSQNKRAFLTGFIRIIINLAVSSFLGYLVVKMSAASHVFDSLLKRETFEYGGFIVYVVVFIVSFYIFFTIFEVIYKKIKK